jgi:hypothetical protein
MPSGSGYAGAGAPQERAAVTIHAAGRAAGADLPLTWVRGEPKAEAAITAAATTAAAAGAGGQGGEGGEGGEGPKPRHGDVRRGARARRRRKNGNEPPLQARGSFIYPRSWRALHKTVP